ncbi:MAG TPA: tape measure protein [Roseateles sp.]
MNTTPINVEIQANVGGRENVVDLTRRLDDMAKVLEGDLKAQAQAAADRLRELARQQEAINTFERLKREATDAAAALKRAEAEAQNFGQQIGQAGPPTAREAEALQRLQGATEAARAKMVEQRTALAGAVGELQNYGIASKNAKDAQQRLAAESEQVRAAVANLLPAYQGAARGATEAGAQIQRTHRAIGEGVDSISTQLGRVQNAFIALQGGGFLGGLIKDAAETADAYNGLAARIKLATGEGQAFRAGMEGVQQIALETRSGLEATGELFARIATAGKQLNLTNQESLDLTRTINQSVQITGGSVQAAEAAITQLNQGLQSGVLRGDEFNSVMEQSPRLAKALADGLGVTTGRLREMAAEGQLTSETIIKALKGQSDTISAEFAKLPPTVGGALQNLSTQWMIYIGNLDKSTGASKTAAEAIAYLANNLDTIVGTLATVGKGVVALQLLKLASHFKDWAVGAATATTALTANTAATVANTAAARANAAAVTAAGAASVDAATKKGLLSTAMGGVAAAGRGVVGMLGGPVGLLVLTATYAKDLGEVAAKLVLKARGLKTVEEAEKDLAAQEKRSYEQAQALAKARSDQAAADKAAAEAKFGLSDAAKKLIGEFDELIKKGQTADEAINAIGKKFDLASSPGIKAAAGVLDKLAADGKLTAEQVQKAWAEALDGQDLAKFEILARAALDGTQRSAEQLSQVIDAQLREAIKRAGLDMGLISTGMSQAAVKAINDTEALIAGFDRLKAQGLDAGRVLAASFVKAIDTADSQQALDALTQRIKAARQLLGDKITNGLLDQISAQADQVKLKMDGMLPGIQSVAEAMKVLGVTSQKSLSETAAQFKAAYEIMRNSGTATAGELQEGFVRYAEAAIKANKGVASESLKVEAAMRGLEIGVDRAGRVFIQAMGDAETSTRRTTRAIDDQVAAFGRLNTVAKTAGKIDGSGMDSFRSGVSSTSGMMAGQGGGAVDNSYPFDLWARFQAGQISANDLAGAQNALRVAQENAKLGNPGSVSPEGRANDQMWISRLQQIVSAAELASGIGGLNPGTRGTDSSAASPAPASTTSTSHTVNISIGGGASTAINTASAADAERLKNLMTELGNASRRAA